MIKGGGGALTREKIVADMAERFVCIADESKLVQTLGRFPLPVEVIPMARALVARRLRALGGEPVLREGFVTDNGCQHPRRARPGDHRSGGDRARARPVAGRRHGGRVRAQSRQHVPARHAGGRAHAQLLMPVGLPAMPEPARKQRNLAEYDSHTTSRTPGPWQNPTTRLKSASASD